MAEIDYISEEDKKRLNLLKVRVNLLFLNHLAREPWEDLRVVQEYYAYLADSIEHRAFRIDADPELVKAFESITLLVTERLKLYPESIQSRVTTILEKNSVQHVFSVVPNIL